MYKEVLIIVSTLFFATLHAQHNHVKLPSTKHALEKLMSDATNVHEQQNILQALTTKTPDSTKKSKIQFPKCLTITQNKRTGSFSHVHETTEFFKTYTMPIAAYALIYGVGEYISGASEHEDYKKILTELAERAECPVGFDTEIFNICDIEARIKLKNKEEENEPTIFKNLFLENMTTEKQEQIRDKLFLEKMEFVLNLFNTTLQRRTTTTIN